MNLLTDDFLSVRRISDNKHVWVSLRDILCTKEEYHFMYPRDDLELGALCLCISIVQCLWPPADKSALKKRINLTMSSKDYDDGIRDYIQWFNIEDKKYPFMQVKGVKANEVTPLDKMLPGITGGTNCTFVNEPNLAIGLCGGCVGVALFNDATNAPGYGGGFKAGLRGDSPITTLIQGSHIQQTIWLNILTIEGIKKYFIPSEKLNNKPTWVDPIIRNSKINALSIGLMRGLFWQPLHITLCPSINGEICSCCARKTEKLYINFIKEKFNFAVEETWPHPHSPRFFILKSQKKEEKYISYRTIAPSWTHLDRFVIKQEISKIQDTGNTPASVVQQAKDLFIKNTNNYLLLTGGYQVSKATILDRRHEIMMIGIMKDEYLKEIVTIGLSFKDGLRAALFLFSKGLEDLIEKKKICRGIGFHFKKNKKIYYSLVEKGIKNYYKNTQAIIEQYIAATNNNNFAEQIIELKKTLKNIGWTIFCEQTKPYIHDPQLIRTLAVAKKTWWKKVKELEPIEKEVRDE